MQSVGIKETFDPWDLRDVAHIFDDSVEHTVHEDEVDALHFERLALLDREPEQKVKRGKVRWRVEGSDEWQEHTIRYRWDRDRLISKLVHNVNRCKKAELRFISSIPKLERQDFVDNLGQAFGKCLDFSLERFEKRSVQIEAASITTRSRDDERALMDEKSYSDGTVERILFDRKTKRRHQERLYSDGVKEVGDFDSITGMLASGYRVEKGILSFLNPRSLFTNDSGNWALGVLDVEGSLVVVEKKYEDSQITCAINEKQSVEDVLFHECLNDFDPQNKNSITKVMLHEDFQKNLESFLQRAFALDDKGVPNIFSFSARAITSVIEVWHDIYQAHLDLKKLYNPVTQKNILAHLASFGDMVFMDKMIDLFPKEFSEEGSLILHSVLRKGCSPSFAQYLFNEMRKRKCEIHYFVYFAYLASQGKKFSDKEKEEFQKMAQDQQQFVYDVAYLYNNPFIYEPLEKPIQPDQYSINLMWINKERLEDSEKCIFGRGATVKERRNDGYENFIKPIALWAKANPGTKVSLWVDRDMIPKKVLEKTVKTFMKELQGETEGRLEIRNIRSLDTVKQNPTVFDEKMPIYFRVDLLRAIIADHVLRKKEVQYFVYGDIDMKPLSGEELFDKKTVRFLDDVGFVMAKGGYLGFENGFYIFNGENKQFLESHKKVVIDLTLEVAKEAPEKIEEQQIYHTYPAMLTHILDKDGRFGHFSPKVSETVKDGRITPLLRYDIFERRAHECLPLGEEDKMLKDVMPCKPVALPPSHFGS